MNRKARQKLEKKLEYAEYQKSIDLHNGKGIRGDKLKCCKHTGGAKIEDQKKAELVVYLENNKYITLRQDIAKGVSMKAITLKATRPDKVNMPFEHLTYARIDKIL